MPKLFVVSDVHSYYDEMKRALDEVGFDPANEDHWLISCGDALDRGPKSQEVLDYLMNLPRCVLVKGNHDLLIMDCLKRGFAQSYDYGNGTARSIIDLAPYSKTFNEACIVAYEKVKPFVNRMVNYFETKNYIFVHSWIAVECNDDLPDYYTRNRKFEFDPDWRYARRKAWERAMWGNPFYMAQNGFLPDKTVVFGHWGTYEQRPVDYEGEDFFDPIYGNGYIGIDATTALSGKVNVLVLEDDFVENNT